MKKFFKYYLFKVVTIGGLLFLQLAALLACSCWAFLCLDFLRIALRIGAVILALRVAVLPYNIPCRIGWIIGILALPAVFMPLYFLFGRGGSIRRINKFVNENKLLPADEEQNEISAPPHIAKQFLTLRKKGGFPISQNSVCTYYPSGEDMFSGIKEIISRAEKYIFMEFFIISEGKMWGEVLELLKEKAKQGVKIYILRDELGTICLLPKNYNQKLKKFGIECRIFNALSPKIKPDINYRDHRKIVSADGIYAITGGANIADEYINAVSPYGYWKDTAVYLEGESAWSLSQMFIQMWNMSGGQLSPDSFKPNLLPSNNGYTGITQPFGDYPSCHMGFSESVFINMVTNAQKTAYITTPYLIPDQPLVSALCRAAENGTDVRLFTPLVPDKKYIHIMTRANYIPLLKSGVKIYEYSKGFIHSKSILCDGNLGYVGSANLDYRSLYLHFECGVLMYDAAACTQLKNDFEEILNVSVPIQKNDKSVLKAKHNVFYRVLRIFSGLL